MNDSAIVAKIISASTFGIVLRGDEEAEFWIDFTLASKHPNKLECLKHILVNNYLPFRFLSVIQSLEGDFNTNMISTFEAIKCSNLHPHSPKMKEYYSFFLIQVVQILRVLKSDSRDIFEDILKYCYKHNINISEFGIIADLDLAYLCGKHKVFNPAVYHLAESSNSTIKRYLYEQYL